MGTGEYSSFSFFIGMVYKILFVEATFEQRPKVSERATILVSRGGAFQAEEIARTKALEWEGTW